LSTLVTVLVTNVVTDLVIPERAMAMALFLIYTNTTPVVFGLVVVCILYITL